MLNVSTRNVLHFVLPLGYVFYCSVNISVIQIIRLIER